MPSRAADSDMPDAIQQSILRPGRNCARLARAGRAAWLIDGADYFEAAADAMERARRSIYLLGWDLNSQLCLRRRGGDDGGGEPLAPFLDRLVSRRRRLHVYVLGWDFALFYALERELLSRVRFGWRTHRRIHFQLDDAHPLGASQHQKLLVVDDAVAFCGGLDLTACRWDTPEHPADDPRRRDPGFPEYAPFHDVQIAVDGEAAAALGALCRERWRRATGRRPRPAAPAAGGDAWPPALAPVARDTEVGIARTEPGFDGRSEVRELEALHLDAFASARRSIYLENQYFTCPALADALAERLREADGPDVVMVCPERCSGWLEEATMGLLRNRLVRRLREADAHGRLRVYHPVLPGERRHPLVVHSKVVVVDERLALVSSANLASRSMGFDTECGVALEARGREEVARAVAALRDRLLAEHLGRTPEEVGRAVAADGLVAAIEKLRGGERTLGPVAIPDDPEWAARLLPEGAPIDPERPIEALWARERPSLGGLFAGEPDAGRWVRVGVVVALLAALAAVWRTTSLGEWVTPERLAALAEPLRAGPGGWALGVALFAAASLVLVPVTALIPAAALAFGFGPGSAVAGAGVIVSALCAYGVGALLWRDALRRVAGGSFQQVSRWLGRSGFAAVAALRVVPIAPFTVVNLVAGASRVPLGDYVLGTCLGMGPGLLVLAFFADRAVAAVRDPSPASIALAVGGAALLVAATWGLRRWLGRAAARGDDPETDAHADPGRDDPETDAHAG